MGLQADQLEPCAEQDGIRIEFEQNFVLELQEPNRHSCRVSSRVCQLGKSLEIQEKQVRRALEIFSEVKKEAPSGSSLAISKHDNCLRTAFDILEENHPDCVKSFNCFIEFAFAYRYTYMAHR
jgi:hypothetical protein